MTVGADHAAYLWAAYGVTAVVLIYNVLAAWLLARRALRDARSAQAQQPLP